MLPNQLNNMNNKYTLKVLIKTGQKKVTTLNISFLILKTNALYLVNNCSEFLFRRTKSVDDALKENVFITPEPPTRIQQLFSTTPANKIFEK